MTFSAVRGELVVGNKYMTHMIDPNKSHKGFGCGVLAYNTLCKEDAIRAIVMLKNAMEGVGFSRRIRSGLLIAKKIICV